MSSKPSPVVIKTTDSQNISSNKTLPLEHQIQLKAMEIALGYEAAHVKEKPHGSNSGPEVSMFLKDAGIGFPAAWCGAFVYHCVKKACEFYSTPTNKIAVPFDWKGSHGYTPDFERWARANKYIVYTSKEVEPGMCFLLYYPSLKRVGHIGFIVSPVTSKPGYYHTVEGNTDDSGSPTGGAVLQKIRKPYMIFRYFKNSPSTGISNLVSEETREARYKMVELISELYSIAPMAKLTQKDGHALNELRYCPSLKDIELKR